MSPIHWLGANDPFPNPLIENDPDPSVPGLIAVSERIYPGQLLAAYRLGIFPWYSGNQPVLWWSPDPRMVLRPEAFNCHASFKKTIRQFLLNPQSQICIDADFGAVMRLCATNKRKDQDGTWITHEIMESYMTFYEQGYAHSISVHHNDQLVGGLYYVAIGGLLFGESMFALQPDASKLALAALCAWCVQNGVKMIDCQQETKHLSSLGASPVTRKLFLEILHVAISQSNIHIPSTFNKTILRHWL
jgi:leucyl/phenylalanyl-tRNA--protein transferase